MCLIEPSKTSPFVRMELEYAFSNEPVYLYGNLHENSLKRFVWLYGIRMHKDLLSIGLFACIELEYIRIH